MTLHTYTPLSNVPTKYQLPTPYGFRDTATPTPPIQCPYKINFLHLTLSEIQPRQDFIGQGHYGKVKSRSHHDVAHLHPLRNVPTKYQLPAPYSF